MASMIMEKVFFSILTVYLLTLCGCVAVGFYYRNAFSKAFLFLFSLVCATILVESIGYGYQVAAYFYEIKKSGNWIFHFYLPILYLLMNLYFKEIINDPTVKKYITYSIVLVWSWSIINSIFFQDLRELNSYAILLVSFFFCIWTIIYLLQVLKSNEDESLWYNPHFWICTGTLFFYSDAFFLFGAINFIKKNNYVLAQQLWMGINLFLNIVMYNLYTYGFICQAKRQKLIL